MTTKNPNIPDAPPPSPGFITWDDNYESRTKAMEEYSLALEGFSGKRSSNRAKSAFYQDLSDLSANTSGRPGLTRSDYDKFRPDERIPKKFPQIINFSDRLYQTTGLLRNTVDLMGDFASQGVRIAHPNKRIEKFYQNWFKRVQGEERSERFLNNLYRTAIVVIRRQTAKINKKTSTELHCAKGDPDIKIVQEKVKKREIPWRYTFINPGIINVSGGELAAFTNKPIYTITLSSDLRRIINSPNSAEERKLVAQLPDDIKKAANDNGEYVLDPEKTSVFHYKKDDWRAWAYPISYAVADDLGIVEKLKLADVAALDGAISNVRLWKLGSLEHRIAPTRIAAAKLGEILENNVGGGTMDLIWGPDLELMETKSNVHEFLGEEKYKPHLNNIYTGLGIPPTLTGTFGTSGTTNNYISLKTLVQRLEYGRKKLVEFWNQEIAIVQKAMGFRLPATIDFDIANLGDEVAEKSLLVQLADRQLISEELLQERFGSDPIMEKIRIQREQGERDKGQRPSKAGPFHNSQYGLDFKKIGLQVGDLTPGQTGLEPNAKQEHLRLHEKQPGEIPAIERKSGEPADTKKSGIPQQGRPKNSKDSKQRKKKEFKPKKKATLALWAGNAQTYIADVLNPYILKQYNKKNLRSLSSDEMISAEEVRFGVLCALIPFSELNNNTILEALQNKNKLSLVKSVYDDFIGGVRVEVGRELTIDEIRSLQVNFYINEEELTNGED